MSDALASDVPTAPQVPGSNLVVTPPRLAPGANLGALCSSYYPLSSRMAYESGVISLLIFIDVDGRASDVRVENGSGYVALDEAAQACILDRGRFIPQTVNGAPVGVWHTMKFTWALATPSREDATSDLMTAYKKGDFPRLARLLRPFADKGTIDAQVMLGRLYLYGTGVTADSAEAAGWMRKAAERGSAVGQYELGILSELGDGVPKDYKAAAAWLRKAAHQGHAGAAFSLALLYQSGLGVERSDALALMWGELAIASTAANSPEVVHADYLELRDSLRARVAPGQLEATYRRAPLEAPMPRAYFRNRAVVEKASRDAYPANLDEHFGLRTIAMLVRVNAEGHVSEIRLETPSGLPRLDAATLDLISEAELVPRKVREQAVEGWQFITWTWALH